VREHLEREKRLVLRSIKELEFDHEMGKVSNEDFAEIGARLREHALQILKDLERDEAARTERRPAASTGQPTQPVVVAPPPPAAPAATAAVVTCASCQGENDVDARFCKHCGAKL
jgi:hypothetical protein